MDFFSGMAKECRVKKEISYLFRLVWNTGLKILVMILRPGLFSMALTAAKLNNSVFQQPDKFLHAFSCRFFNSGEVRKICCYRHPFVYNIFWCKSRYIIDQTGSRVNNQGSAYHNKEISTIYNRDRFFDHGHGLFKPYNSRAKLAPIFCFVPKVYIPANLINKLFIPFTSHFKYLAVQMQNIGGTSPFMKVINILGNDRYIKILFQFS